MEKYISLQDFEDAATNVLAKPAMEYFRNGATEQQTLAENRLAFRRLRILPKCLMGITGADLRTTILGHEVSMPVGIAPSAMQKTAHHDGEVAIAKAAQAEGTIYTLSTASTCSIEEVASAAPDAIKWFQVYVFRDREVTRKLVMRAEKAGFKALLLTVDTPVFGIIRSDIRNSYAFAEHLKLANFVEYFSKSDNADDDMKDYVGKLFEKTLTWEDVKWLKSITKLPVIAKGILRAEDAVKAAEMGCSGILVSNHGARQLDGLPATIEVLPEVVDALKNYNVEVYMDGGVTTGNDVYKALALGAKMVLVGRPALWGLAVGGQAGVQRTLNILRTELESTVQIAGTPTVADITRDMVRHESSFRKL
ncbi:unnamed protein product [Diatraea saccharalis]|uniref:(S)-2-hydroxy-acid oxidase n=1 Tax=Diatraea saccharalis TaxID=40085 RepID=A0A9N9WKQ8_9NEOP|nr:unnamed protein product [Diatraea saccharalis]